MPFEAAHIAYLFYRAQAEELTADEQQAWEQFLATEPETASRLLQLDETALLRLFEERRSTANRERTEKMLAALKEQLSFSSPASADRVAHRVHFLRTAWFRIAVALLLIAGTGAYLWNLRHKKEIASTETQSEKPDIMPGSHKALLTLADGSVITLDTAAKGEFARQTGAIIQKSTGGEIVYAFDKNSAGSTVAYNTMSTPRGGTYQLILPDGSKVWLNAASSITFPTVFTGNKRTVKMTGEVYFEVKHNKEKPFIVSVMHAAGERDNKTHEAYAIEVLGTHFNVNAYDDVPVKTSLLEGKVKIDANILTPGQAFAQGKIIATDIAQDVAWKKGAFNFDNLPLPVALKQLSRWYDIDIKYEGGTMVQGLEGEIGRDLRLSQVLTILNRLGVRTRLEGRTLIVLPNK